MRYFSTPGGQPKKQSEDSKSSSNYEEGFDDLLKQGNVTADQKKEFDQRI